ATYAPQLRKEDEEIDWEKTAAQVNNHIRGMNPWPGTHTIFNGKVLKVLEAETTDSAGSFKPGTVIKIDEKGIYVQCGQGAVILKRLKLEGKKEMWADAFCRGQKDLKPGLILGGLQ